MNGSNRLSERTRIATEDAEFLKNPLLVRDKANVAFKSILEVQNDLLHPFWDYVKRRVLSEMTEFPQFPDKYDFPLKPKVHERSIVYNVKPKRGVRYKCFVTGYWTDEEFYLRLDPVVKRQLVFGKRSMEKVIKEFPDGYWSHCELQNIPKWRPLCQRFARLAETMKELKMATLEINKYDMFTPFKYLPRMEEILPKMMHVVDWYKESDEFASNCLPSTQQEGEDEIDVETATDKRMEENIQRTYASFIRYTRAKLNAFFSVSF